MDRTRVDRSHYGFLGSASNINGLHSYEESILSGPFPARGGGSRLLSRHNCLPEPLVSLSGSRQSGRSFYGGNFHLKHYRVTNFGPTAGSQLPRPCGLALALYY